MEKIINNMEVLPTWKDFPDEMEMVLSASVYEDDSRGVLRPGSFGLVEGYVLKAEICIDFRCNKAELESATRRARKMAARRLYWRQRQYAEEAIYAVQNGNKTLALKLLHELLGSMDTD